MKPYAHATLVIAVLLTAAMGARLKGDDDESLQRVDSLFAEWDRTTSPGCALAVIRDGRIVHARGYGMADLERSITLTPRSVFDIASTSKQFVAMCVLLLEEEGKLSLDDDLRKYFPSMPDYGEPITIRHLVHHTSGIRDYLVLMFLAGMPMENDYPEAQIVDLISRQKALNFAPGAEHLYSNSGYFLLGEIVHRVSGMTLGEYARRNIFEPLGMSSTQFYDDFKRVVPDRAIGYLPTEGGGFATELYLFDLVGDGGVLTTVEDLLVWDRNFYANRVGAGEQSLIDRMLTPGRLANGETLGYACGLGVSTYRGLKTVSHGGAWAGYRSQLLRFPEQRFSVVVLSNLGTFNPTGLARQVADILLADEFPEPSPGDAGGAGETAETEAPPGDEEAPITVTAAELSRWAGAYRRRAGGSIWRVMLADDRLQVVAGERTYPLDSLGKSRFRAIGVPVAVHLRFEPAGDRTALHVDIEGAETRTYDLVELASPTTDELEAIAGRYESEELDVVYELTLVDGVLQAALTYREPMSLEPTVADEFLIDDFVLRLRRDGGGAVDGFAIDAGRVKNIVFERVR
ncbi:MAG: serine hydrolase domain-containing protein [Planctomycetota bacterium]|jgi:CubicO group peptidase (beta-lactamase class C family)